MSRKALSKQPKPSFKNPPVIEVVAGVQFENPINFRTLDVADFWAAFDKKKFTNYRDMSPLDPMLPDNVHVIEMYELPKMRRFWFETEKDDELLQIQQDRLIYNWKRPSDNLDDENCYPRYEPVIKNFFKYYDILLKTLEDKKIESSKPSFLELSYINLIDMPEKGLANIGSVFKDISWSENNRFLPVPENLQHRNFFQIPSLPLRLVTDLSMRQRVRDGKIALHYELSVRGPINNLSSDDMREWFDNARLWITYGFVDTTSEKMHEKWGIE